MLRLNLSLWNPVVSLAYPFVAPVILHFIFIDRRQLSYCSWSSRAAVKQCVTASTSGCIKHSYGWGLKEAYATSNYLNFRLPRWVFSSKSDG